jgi:FtsH-binding integral membrane protein
MAEFNTGNIKATSPLSNASLLAGTQQLMDKDMKFLAIMVLVSGPGSLLLLLLLLASFFIPGFPPPLFWGCLLVGVFGVFVTSGAVFSKLRKHEQTSTRQLG